MMTYDVFSWSGRRAPALALVIGLHAILVIGLWSEFMSRVTKRVPPPPLVVQMLMVPPQPVKPTPPEITKTRPHDTLKLPPSQPPPRDPVEKPAEDGPIPLEPRVADVLPPPIPAEHRLEAARFDPKHPLRLGEEYYPDEARRRGEEGRCQVRVEVAADGRITSTLLEEGTGSTRLDAACLNALKGQRMLPATEDGTPVASHVTIPITWRLSPPP